MKKTVKIDPTLMDPDKYEDNHVEECADMLLECEEIKKNAKLMEKIHEHWDKKGKKIDSIKKLREVANNYTEKDEE